MSAENPPAFACASDGACQPGMTLRDWFAGQALAGMCANATWIDLVARIARQKGIEEPAALAQCAYGTADAMLAERNRVQS